MQSIAILGAGELGATLARKLAEAELARRVVLVDREVGKAQGKALDLLQSGPVEGYDTRVEGAPELAAVGEADAVIVADPPELLDASTGAAAAFAQGLVPQIGSAILLVAGAHGPAMVDAAVGKKAKRERVLGSAPVAFAASLRRAVAEELRVRAEDVTALVMGLPPGYLLAPRAAVTVGGLLADALSPVVVRRAVEAVRRRRLGPVALATAAVAVVRALCGRPGAVLPVTARLDGEYGHRNVALAVPARLGGGRFEVMELGLEPVDRVAMDAAAQRRFEGEEG